MLEGRVRRVRLPAALGVGLLVVCAVAASGASASDHGRPTKPSNLTKIAATENTLTVSWGRSRDNAGVTGYRVFRNGTLVTRVTGRSRSYTLAGLSCNTAYIVMVAARDGAGNISLPATIFGKTAACGSAQPDCPTSETVVGLLRAHNIRYGCSWPGGTFAKQAVNSVRVMLAARASSLDTWRAKKWHRVALAELDAAAKMPNAWGPQGVLRSNSAGLAVQYKLGRVIRILQWHNPELYEVSKSEKWALTAISWYIAASEYNRRLAELGATPTMQRAEADLKRADADFFTLTCYRAWGRYRQAWQRVTGL